MTGTTVRVMAGSAALALGVTACGGGTQGDEGPSVEEGGTLTFANYQWGEPERGEAIWEAVSGYTEENPQVELEQQEISRQEYENTLNTQMGGGEGPDLLIIPDTYLMELAGGQLLEPLDDVLDAEDEERLTEYNEFANVEGEQLALSWDTAPYALFWNSNILDEAGVEPPTTPEELVEAAVEIEENTDAAGFAARHQMNEEVPWWVDFGNWPLGFGGGWSDGQELTIDSSENIEALTAFKEVYDSGGLTVGDDASTFRSRFAEGEVGMGIDNSAALYSTVGGDGELDSEDVEASALPFPGDASVRLGVNVGVNVHSENKTLAKDFLRWMFAEEGQERLSHAVAPSSVGTADTPIPEEVVEEHPWVPDFEDQLPESHPEVIEGFEVETPRIRSFILPEVERVLTDDADPAEALEQAQDQATSEVE